MKILQRLSSIVLLISLSFFSLSIEAYPICLKSGVILNDSDIVTGDNLEDYYGICPWFEKEILELARRLTINIVEEKKTDIMISALAYGLAISLKNSPHDEGKINSELYLEYSYLLALRYGMTRVEHDYEMAYFRKDNHFYSLYR